MMVPGMDTGSHNNSSRAFDRAVNIIPGGVNSPVRAFGSVDGKPIFIESARGSRIYDIDGNEYIDYVGSWGPMILGHTCPSVIKQVIHAAARGTSFGAATVGEVELAQQIIDAYPAIDKVRLVSSGTEAVMSAIRLARAYTRRDLIIKMQGGYHGHSDGLLVQAGSGVAQTSTASSAGVPQDIAKLTIVVPFNDLDAVRTAFETYPEQIAAVLVEPVAANMGVIAPVEGYLQGLRDICDINDALLMFDEVITGFRIAYGGAQERYGIHSDITCLGKVVGGGLPMAAFGAREAIMNLLAPCGPVYQAGTLSGNPLATAAANATLEILRSMDIYQTLEQRSAVLEEGLKAAAVDAGIAVTINRVGSIMSCFFTDRPVRNFTDVQSQNIDQFKQYFSQMLQRGIYLAPSAYEAMFVSLAHSDEDIERTIQAARESFVLLK